MGAVHIRIGHNNDFIIAESADIKVIAVAFGKSAAKGVNHGFNFRIGKNLINARFFDVQNLSADWKNGLKMTVSGGFCRTSGGISFDNENFTDGSVPAFTVGKFSVGIKGKFWLGQEIGLCLFFALTDFCRFFRTGEDIF